VRHPCFDFTTEGGKRIFNTNESKHSRGSGARRLLCDPQTTTIHRGAKLRTSHKFGAPLVSQTSLRGGNTFTMPQNQNLKPNEQSRCNLT
jgi:hypothetical protein